MAVGVVAATRALWATPAGAAGTGGHAAAAPAPPAVAARSLPSPLYGVTVDDVGNLDDIVESSEHLPEMPTTRIYFDVRQRRSHYSAAVSALHPVSYLMGELLDSSDEKKISPAPTTSESSPSCRLSVARSTSGRWATRSTATGPVGTKSWPRS
ncbi:MAG TPA: hypothetical protein VMF60_10305 [Acidimicrobiales bacterium]|nr:hypothetical protein [Acidimicrobiales bacterium]